MHAKTVIAQPSKIGQQATFPSEIDEISDDFEEEKEVIDLSCIEEDQN